MEKNLRHFPLRGGGLICHQAFSFVLTKNRCLFVQYTPPDVIFASYFGKYVSIYPSQRQNLLPTLKILIRNFENFQFFKILEKNSQVQNFFSKISKTAKGPPLTSKGPPPPHYPVTKFSFFSRVSKARGI